jgi:hypothetical protein
MRVRPHTHSSMRGRVHIRAGHFGVRSATRHPRTGVYARDDGGYAAGPDERGERRDAARAPKLPVEVPAFDRAYPHGLSSRRACEEALTWTPRSHGKLHQTHCSSRVQRVCPARVAVALTSSCPATGAIVRCAPGNCTPRAGIVVRWAPAWSCAAHRRVRATRAGYRRTPHAGMVTRRVQCASTSAYGTLMHCGL